MTLAMAPSDVPVKIVRYKEKGGSNGQNNHLANLGFVEGETVTVVAEVQGNLIVNVKGSRIAIGKEIATRILVEL